MDGIVVVPTYFINESDEIRAGLVPVRIGNRLVGNSLSGLDEVRGHWMLRYIPCNLPEYVIYFDENAERIHPPVYCVCMLPIVDELNRVGAKYGVEFYVARNCIIKKMSRVRVSLNRGLAQLLLANYGNDPFELLRFVESGSCLMPLPYKLNLHMVGRSGTSGVWMSIPYQMRYEPGSIYARAKVGWMRDLHLILDGMVIT